MRLNNDKYYTPEEVVLKCLGELKQVLKEDNIIPSRVIEPSAGNGAFSKKIKNCIAYDIEPEDVDIIQADFLKLDIPYLKDSVVVGNPPFGEKFSLGIKFFKHCIQHSDYIAFILPIRQLNNTKVLYEFDLVRSIDLGLCRYSDRELHCCFNIYKRPNKGLNKKSDHKLKCVEIVRNDSKRFEKFEYDIRLCNWGNGSGGKILKDDEKASGVYKIKIDSRFKDRVIEVLSQADWHKITKNIAMLSIKQYHIIDLLKEKIPDIY